MPSHYSEEEKKKKGMRAWEFNPGSKKTKGTRTGKTYEERWGELTEEERQSFGSLERFEIAGEEHWAREREKSREGEITPKIAPVLPVPEVKTTGGGSGKTPGHELTHAKIKPGMPFKMKGSPMKRNFGIGG